MEEKKTTGEIECQYMDFEKVDKYFSWCPKHSFRDGLKKTIEWFRLYNEHRFSAMTTENIFKNNES